MASSGRLVALSEFFRSSFLRSNLDLGFQRAIMLILGVSVNFNDGEVSIGIFSKYFRREGLVSTSLPWP